MTGTNTTLLADSKAEGSHTPGPWEIDPSWGPTAEHPNWANVRIGNAGVSGHIGAANARLISAAPEMLTALKASMALGMKIYHNANAHEATMDWAQVKALMEAAIAKATAR